MIQEKAIKTLKQYAKFFAGRGKKYLANIPNLNPDELVEAMKYAENHLSYRICPLDFKTITMCAQAHIVDSKLKGEEPYKTAIRNAQSVCRRLDKRESK